MRVEIEDLSDYQFWNPPEPPKTTLSGVFFVSSCVVTSSTCCGFWVPFKSTLGTICCPQPDRNVQVWASFRGIVLHRPPSSWQHYGRKHMRGGRCFSLCFFPHHASFRPSLHLRSPLWLDWLEGVLSWWRVINPRHIGWAVALRQNRAGIAPNPSCSLALGECLS